MELEDVPADDETSSTGPSSWTRQDLPLLPTPPPVIHGDSSGKCPEIPVEVTSGIASFTAPAGYVRCKVPPPSANRSILYEWGVRMERDVKLLSASERQAVEGKRSRPQLFMCFASEKCRKLLEDAVKSNKVVSVGKSMTSTQTTGATNHLRDIHGVIGEKAQKQSARWVVPEFCATTYCSRLHYKSSYRLHILLQLYRYTGVDEALAFSCTAVLFFKRTQDARKRNLSVYEYLYPEK